MTARVELAWAIRELAGAALEVARAGRDIAAAIRGRSALGTPSEDRKTMDLVHWQQTDLAFARRALRPLGNTTAEERTILERMRLRLRKTTPSPEADK